MARLTLYARDACGYDEHAFELDKYTSILVELANGTVEIVPSLDGSTLFIERDTGTGAIVATPELRQERAFTSRRVQLAIKED
jgi:hypothetical protein